MASVQQPLPKFVVLDLWDAAQTAAAHFQGLESRIGSTPVIDPVKAVETAFKHLNESKYDLLILTNVLDGNALQKGWQMNTKVPGESFNYNLPNVIKELLKAGNYISKKIELSSQTLGSTQLAYVVARSGTRIPDPNPQTPNVLEVGGGAERAELSSLRLIISTNPEIPENVILHKDPKTTVFIGVEFPGESPPLLPREIKGYETVTYDPGQGQYSSSLNLICEPAEIWNRSTELITRSIYKPVVWFIRESSSVFCVKSTFTQQLVLSAGQSSLDTKEEWTLNRYKPEYTSIAEKIKGSLSIWRHFQRKSVGSSKLNKVPWQSVRITLPVFSIEPNKCLDPWVEHFKLLNVEEAFESKTLGKTSEELAREEQKRQGVAREIADIDVEPEFVTPAPLPIQELNRAYKTKSVQDLTAAATALYTAINSELKNQKASPNLGLLSAKYLEINRLLKNLEIETVGGISADAYYRRENRSETAAKVPFTWFNQQLGQIIPDLNGRALYPAMFRGRPMQKTILIVSDDDSEATALVHWLAHVGMLKLHVRNANDLGSTAKGIAASIRELMQQAYRDRPSMVYLDIDFLNILPNNEQETRKILTFFFTVLQDLMDSSYPIYFVVRSSKANWKGSASKGVKPVDPALSRRFLYKLDLTQPTAHDLAMVAQTAALPEAQLAAVFEDAASTPITISADLLKAAQTLEGQWISTAGLFLDFQSKARVTQGTTAQQLLATVQGGRRR